MYVVETGRGKEGASAPNVRKDGKLNSPDFVIGMIYVVTGILHLRREFINVSSALIYISKEALSCLNWQTVTPRCHGPKSFLSGEA